MPCAQSRQTVHTASTDAFSIHTAGLPLSATTVYAIGECMIELQRSATGMDYRFGGDTLNAAVYLARLLEPELARVAYVTGIGIDGMSDEMLAGWQAERIVTSSVLRLPERLPGIYLIETAPDGERRFHYWRRDSAARHWMAAPGANAVLEQLAHAAMIYLSGISLAILAPEHRARLMDVLARCRANGGRVVFDNNYRPRLWDSAAQAAAAYAEVLVHCDVALLTLDDEQLLYGSGDGAASAIARARAFGVGEVIVKCGGAPCVVWADGVAIEVAPAPVAAVVDTTAAGDSFGAGYL